MDLHYTADRPSPEEEAAIEGCLDGLEAAGPRRQYLIPVLHAIQDRIGWVSPGALNHACRRLGVPPAEAFGVADFYALFETRPHPLLTLHVCDDIACQLRGADALCAGVEAALGPEGASRDGRATWHRSPCLGLCERAPAVLALQAGDPPRARVLPAATADAIAEVAAGAADSGAEPAADLVAADLALSVPQLAAAQRPSLTLLARVGRIDPESLDDYRAAGGFAALRRALEIGPEGVVREVVESKLVGRGGAAFPTGLKWQGVRSTSLPRYLICNADESEPGTFKDRVLMENDPFALIEAMTIAGFATGCERGYLYLRGEYPLAHRRLENAIHRCRERGLLGEDVRQGGHGEPVRFDVELRRGAGAYICGEETALMNSLEGLRGEPRNKPPFPTQAGLFGRPTVINNVETLVNVLPIVLGGGKAYAEIGTEKSTGPKLFCLSGHVVRPGVYEAPFGITLRELLDLAGGVGGNGRLRAVLLGGAAGAFVTPSELDVPLTFEGTRAIGATLGSAVVMPFDDSVDLRRILRRITRFFRDESCGQCVPCRVGTVRQEELLARLAADAPQGSWGAELGLLKELGQVMRDASICGLGQTASSAVESAIARSLLEEPR